MSAEVALSSAAIGPARTAQPPTSRRPVEQHRRRTDRTRLAGTHGLYPAHEPLIVDQLDPDLGRLDDHRLGEVRQRYEDAILATEPFAHERSRELAYLVHAHGPRLPALALYEQFLLAAADAEIHVAVSLRLSTGLLYIPASIDRSASRL
jgi:hypothetical protein